jgi:hypothetical protein
METKTLLSQGNAAFIQQNYQEALLCYERALRKTRDVLKASLKYNRDLAERRLHTQFGENALNILERIQAQVDLEDEINAVSPYFDKQYYLDQNQDVFQARIDPVEHYCSNGWREGRNPHPGFSTRFYLETNADVEQADINPYWHYVVKGKFDGRVGQPIINNFNQLEDAIDKDEASPQLDSGDGNDWEHQASTIRPYFDGDFYHAKYPDIEQAGIDPLFHYCMAGWRERRAPSPDFSTAYYLDANPDVADAGINPFWHFIVAGKAEGRLARHPGGYKAEMLKSLTTLEQMARQWKKQEPPPDPLSSEQVAGLIAQGMSATINRLAISIGHDNYRKISGGVQLCIHREERIASERGTLYLNAHPWQPLPRLANETEGGDPLLCLILAGQDAGVCHSSVLVHAVSQVADQFHGNVHVIIHSLLGHSVEWAKHLINLSKGQRCWFWLHDFFTLCPSHALQRNNVSFCGAPVIESNACAICVYGDERRLHLQRVRGLFEVAAVTAVAPSDVTREFWYSKAKLPKTEVVVLPHMEMEWIEREKPLPYQGDKPIAIGFLGTPTHHKGWNTFESVVKTLSDDARFRFVYFGNIMPPMTDIECVNVHVTADDETAMTRAISEAQIDYVLHWTNCFETFSLTAHEGIAAGAYILTNSNSGNVAAVIEKTGKGAVFENEQALIAFFQEGAAVRMAAAIRTFRAKHYCRLRLSDMTLPLLMNEEGI